MRTIRNRRVAGVVGALTIALGTATPAEAHVVFKGGTGAYLYYSGTMCVAGYSEASHGTYGHGYSKTTTWSTKDGNDLSNIHQNCYSQWSRPAGYFSTDRQWWYSASGAQAIVCRDSGWVYN